MSGTTDDEALFVARTERLHLSQTEVGVTLRATEGAATVEEIDPAELPRITLDTRGDASIPPAPSHRPDLALVSTLGEGGMGRVHLARQQSLARDVAVKTLKSDATPAVAQALLREARVTGKLEHPGVIPVHALGVDESGRPMLVMKRVDGVDLSTRLKGEPQSGERLVAILEALMQVCRTCEFAHSRGIVHRDIKPENIMVGGFGEVYLLDWGIATKMDSTPGSEAIVGTPVYMSPEMVLGRKVDARTDVYLLGATLHEVLTGRPRHLGRTMMEVARAALLSEPMTYGPDVPDELARLCNRATAKNPDDRPQTAAEMREEIALFLRHRAARAIADAARERLDALETLLRSDVLAAKEIARAYRLVAEARFGLAQSLEQDPSDADARTAARRCQLAAVELELRQGHVESAEALYKELDEPDASIDARIAEGRAHEQKKAKERERLARLDHDMDPTQQAKRRTLPLIGLAVVFAAMGLYMSTRVPKLTPEALVFPVVLSGVVLIAALAALWKKVFTNAFNRRAAFMVGVAVAGALANRIVGVVVQRPPEQTLSGDLLLFTVVLSLGAITLLRTFWVCAAILACGLVVSVAVPSQAAHAFVSSSFLNLCAGALILRNVRRRQE